MINFFTDIFIISWREIIKGTREKSRLYGSIVRPIIWLFLLGNGLRPSFNNSLGMDYLHFIFPGIIVMNILFASIQSGTSIIWDREFGFLKEILVAPVSRTSVALGKIFGGTMMSTLQGLIVFVLFPVIGFKITIMQTLITLIAMFFFAFSITSLGALIAVRMKSFEGFGVMNNFVVMPMFFLSQAMYPIDKVPQWIKYLIYINPVNYGVDLVRSILLNVASRHGLFFDIIFLSLFSLIIISFVVIFFNKDSN